MAMVKEFEEIQKNEVLAKWAGITIESVGYTDYLDPDDGAFVSRRIHWPDFTSLDVLFKWCVPKLRRDYVSIQFEYANDLWDVRLHGFDSQLAWSFNHNTPGEALRGAILALIESEKAVG